MNEKEALISIVESKLLAYKGNKLLFQLYKAELERIEEGGAISVVSLDSVGRNSNLSRTSPQERFVRRKMDLEEKLKVYRDAVKEVDIFIKFLNEEDRRIIEMKYIKGYTFEEIGTSMNYSRQAITKRIKSIIQKEAKSKMRV